VKKYSAIIKTKYIKIYKLNPKITKCYAMFLKNKKLLNNNKFKSKASCIIQNLQFFLIKIATIIKLGGSKYKIAFR